MSLKLVVVRVDLGPLRKFEAAVGRADGPVRAAMKQWAARYRGFLQERFVKFSRGGGDWKPLAESTLARRRKGRGSSRFAAGTVAILRDTGTLFASLDPVFRSAPGQLEKQDSFGVDVGFGGPQLHPSGQGVTVADVASFHQTGGPRLPKREIVVDPDARTLAAMKTDMERALRRLAKETGN